MNQISDETLKMLKEDHNRVRDFEIDVQRFNDYMSTSDNKMEKLDKKMEDLKGMIGKIMNNHLFHMNKDIVQMRGNIKWMMIIGGFIILQGVGMLTAILFR